MLTLVTVVPSARRSPPLVADYALFARRRAARRPFLKALLGFAVVLVFGMLVGSLPPGQAELAIGLCLAPAMWLKAEEWIGRHRLRRRLDHARAEVRSAGKS